MTVDDIRELSRRSPRAACVPAAMDDSAHLGKPTTQAPANTARLSRNAESYGPH